MSKKKLILKWGNNLQIMQEFKIQMVLVYLPVAASEKNKVKRILRRESEKLSDYVCACSDAEEE